MNLAKSNHLLNLALAGAICLSPALAGWGQTTDTPANGAPDANQNLKVEDAENPEQTNAPPAEENERSGFSVGHRQGASRGEQVMMGHDAVVKQGQTVESLVVIGGSARVLGKVRRDVVVVRGDLDVQGEVGGDAVVVLGSGKVRTNASVSGNLVTVLGDMLVATNAVVRGDAVAVCGHMDVADETSIHGNIVPINPLGFVSTPRWLKQWLTECVLKLRPLAPGVGWVWGVAGALFLFYLVVAALFTTPVRATVDELTRRPATTFLMGLLTLLLLPVVSLLLIVTGIGVFIVPFVLAAVLLAAIFGKVALFEWIGLGLGARFGSGTMVKPLAAFGLGFLVVTVLYLIPVLGLLTCGLVGIWGLGGGVLAAFGGLRRELPEKPVSPPPGMAVHAMAEEPVGCAAGNPGGSSAFTSAPDPQSAADQPASQTATTPAAPPGVPEVLTLPKASFWERMGAAFLDLVLVSILGTIVGGPPLGLLVALAYFSGMWTWKSTTIGGIVLGLKVARLDGQPVTFAVALVRGLAAAFSAIVLFLGFLWIAWDKDKQGWHDRIAGTVVLKQPRGIPLVCL